MHFFLDVREHFLIPYNVASRGNKNKNIKCIVECYPFILPPTSSPLSFLLLLLCCFPLFDRILISFNGAWSSVTCQIVLGGIFWFSRIKKWRFLGLGNLWGVEVGCFWKYFLSCKARRRPMFWWLSITLMTGDLRNSLFKLPKFQERFLELDTKWAYSLLNNFEG